MIGKLYTKKIPVSIREGMKEITEDDCYLVKRKIVEKSSNNKSNNCHLNVQNLVDKYGGERISGWLLLRDNKTFRMGLFLWIFHSIWKTDDGEYYDVTENEKYNNNDLVTFWLDNSRAADLKEGTAYNSIMLIENCKLAKSMSEKTGINLEKGKAYWTENSGRYYKSIDEHSGIYRYVNDEYTQNRKFLEEKYDCKIVDNGLRANDKNNNKVDVGIFFDFSLSQH